MALRNFSSVASETTLQAGINNVSTVILVASTTGFPVVPFILALDYGAATEEVVLATNVAGLSVTVTRAYDGTAAVSHGPGAKVRHVSSAIDFREANDHVNTSTNVHGLTGGAAVVGTTSSQTLENKIYDLARFTGEIGGGVELQEEFASGSPLVVRGFPASTNSLTTWYDGSNNILAEVEETGLITSTVGLSTPGPAIVGGSTDIAAGSILVASAGWTISGLTVGVLKSGLVTLNGNVTRSGANITIDAAGTPSTGIVAMATIQSPYRPKASLGITYHHAGNSIATGTVRVNTSSTGLIELVRWQASQTITTGNVISFTMTYPNS